MKNIMKLYLVIATTCFAFTNAQAGQPTSPACGAQHCNRAEAPQCVEIEKVLKQYERGLNTADVETIVDVYANDGVLLAPNAPSAVGIDAIRQSYTDTFHAININLSFDIAEVKLLATDWALLRTTSTGVINILANGAQIPEGNQELFLLHKTRGEWKIARYSFSTFLAAAN